MSEETNEKVLSIIADIKKNEYNVSEVENKKDKKTKQPKEVCRGVPKSGRFWKSKKERFSTINKTKGLRLDFEKKTELRLELKRVKDLSKQAAEELKQKEISRKERRRENIKRTAENRQKAEIVQVISNTAKLKRMKKKQLRFIQKRDTNKEVAANK